MRNHNDLTAKAEQCKAEMCRAIAKHREPIPGLDVDEDPDGSHSFADDLLDAISDAWRSRNPNPLHLIDDPGCAGPDDRPPCLTGHECGVDGESDGHGDEPFDDGADYDLWPDDDWAISFREIREIEAHLYRHFGRRVPGSIRVEEREEAEMFGWGR